MSKTLTSLALLALRCRRGAAMIEYALLIGLIALVASASLTAGGANVKAKFTAVSSAI